MRLRDFFEKYYNRGSINIVRVPNVEWYFLLGNTGGIADKTIIYKLDKSQVDGLVAGNLSINDIVKDSRDGFVLDIYESYFTEEDLQQISNSSINQKKTK